MKKRIFSSFLAITLFLSLFSSTGFALDKVAGNTKYSQAEPKAGNVHIVQNQEDLRAKLKDSTVQNGDIIELKGSGFVNDTYSNAAPWVIDKNITIRGGSINLRAGGIILGADVTFENTTLLFANPVRNVIIVNGHKLTLNNVTKDSSGRKMHLLCGGLTGYEHNANVGSRSELIISGSTSVDNIYAGSLSSNGANNSSDIPATIMIDSTSTGQIGTIYSSGAIETIVNSNEMLNPNYEPAPPTSDPSKYITKGAVTIKVSGGKARMIDGKTGGAEDAKVVYNGTQNLNGSLTLVNVSSLMVESGNLHPAQNSSFSNANAHLSVGKDAILNLSNFEQALQISDFTGGGTLILGQKQRLNIQNTVVDTTMIGIESVFSNASSKPPLKNHIYIAAPKSNETSFKLIPHNSAPTTAFQRDKNGSWLVLDGSSAVTKISDISIPNEVSLPTDNNGAEIPITVTYSTPDANPILNTIKMSVMVDSKTAFVGGDAESGFTYTSSIGEIEIAPYDTGEYLCVWGNGDNFEIAPGTYEIKVIISPKYMENNALTTLKTNLKISNDVTPPQQETDLSKATVTVEGEYFYTGVAQTPKVTVELDGKTLNENIDYILSATNNINAGTATVTVQPASNSSYINSISKEFVIQKAPLSYKDAAVAPKTYDGTTNATVTSISFLNENQNTPVNLAQDKDYTVTAQYNDANVKKANSVMVNVRLNGDAASNYDLKVPTITLQGKQIDKATIAANPSKLNVFNHYADSYTYTVSEMLPKLDAPKDYGTKSFKLGTINLGEYYKTGAAINGDVLILPIQKVASDAQKEVGKVDVEITTDNYIISDSFISVNSINKNIPQGTPALSKHTLVYGELLSAITFSGNMTNAEGQVVEGQFNWDNPNTKYPIGTHTATWTFVPTDKNKYLPVSGKEEITVQKAESVGRPQYDTITSTGKTLADAHLNGLQNSFSTPGNVKWQLSANTSVDANRPYQWIFTPDDSNYNIITENVILYPTTAKGGASGSGATPNKNNQR